MPVGSVDSGLGDIDDGRGSRTRSSSEEKESLTPAQSRRKAQNRAAYVLPTYNILIMMLMQYRQRAFRERKERHVKDLENKLSALESSAHSLQSDNERLKLALQRARTENEILRATSGHSPVQSRPVSVSYPSPGAHLPDEDDKDADYNVQSLDNGSVLNAADKDHPASRRRTKGKEIPAAQAWDLIQSHSLVKQGLVDIADVCERLKGAAKCDGHGPVFEESTIWQAVEESRRCGGDELI
jgi:AP-1-like factor